METYWEEGEVFRFINSRAARNRAARQKKKAEKQARKAAEKAAQIQAEKKKA